MIKKLSEILKSNLLDTDNNLFMLLDGCKYQTLWSDLQNGVLKYRILFKEKKLQEELEEVAPYLVQLSFGSDYAKEETAELLSYYGNSGCIFLSSNLNIDNILLDLRNMFYIYTAEKDKGYFRFYDPDILNDLVTQESKIFKEELFRNIIYYWAEDTDDKSIINQYSMKNNDISKIILNLKEEI